MALALYRKYRSATFAEVIGQEHVTEPLAQALTAGRINHAYLFSGPRGCGKTSSARILARSLNCVQGPTPTPCGVCESCLELAPNGTGSIDVIEIDAASHGGVDDARDLRERAFYAPVRDRYKVYIIDEAHMVTTQGFNALLKLIEEPPDFLVFVFATTEPDKVLQTIRSRTHHYPFRLIPPGVMRAHLERICAAEGISVEPAVLPLVVRAGGGSARDSLSVLDQLLAGAGPEGVTYARAVGLLGITDSALLDDMIDALAAADAASVYGTVDRVVEAGHDPRRFSADLLDRFRDLIVLDSVPDAGSRGLIDAPQDELAHMSDQAARLGGATLTRYAEIVHTALIEMRGTTAPRLVLELLCARMQLPDAAADSAALLQRIERLERRQSLVQAGEPTAASTAEASPAPVRPPAAARRSEPARTAEPAARPAEPAARPAEPAASAPPASSPPPAARRPAAKDEASRPEPPASSGGSAARGSSAQSDPTSASASPAAASPAASASPAGASPAASASPAAASWPSLAPLGTEAAAPPPDGAAAVQGPADAPGRSGVEAPAVAPAGALDAVQLRQVWLEVVDRQRPRLKGLLRDSQVLRVEGDLVTISAPSPTLANMIADEDVLQVVRAAIAEQVGGTWRIAVEAAGSGPAGAASTGATAAGVPAGGSTSTGSTATGSTTAGSATAGSSSGGSTPGGSGSSSARPPASPAPSRSPAVEADPRDDTDLDESGAPVAKVDPEADALRLLQSTLGARPVED